MASNKRKKSERNASGKPPVEESKGRGASDSRILGIIKHRAFAAALLFLVSFSVFIPSLRNGLVWDDVTYVETWSARHKSASLDFKLLVPSRSEEARGGKYFRPVYSALVIDNRIWGGSRRSVII